jgi:ketosteroid isomerase-like protein
MKLQSRLVLALIALAVAYSASAFAAPAATESEPIKSERLRQNAAIAKREIETITSFWTDDVTICRGLGVQLAGKAAYRKLFEDDQSGSGRIVYERLPSAIDVSPHWPLAFETGIWNGRLGDLAGPTIISGRYSAQWVKRDDRWLIRAEVYVALDGAGVGLESKAAP